MTDIAISIDVETASNLDVTKVGAYRYAADPSTFVRCLAWRRHDLDQGGIWVPGWPKPDALTEGLRYGEVHAWNAQFERLIFEHCLSGELPLPTFNQWRCTAAQARQNALPGKLEKAAKLLKVEHQKQDTRIMKKLADAEYTPTAEELERLCSYCMGDVRAEMDVGALLPPWTQDELYAYRHNERINDRGVLVDTKFAERMLMHCESAVDDINAELSELTNGEVTAYTQLARMKNFLGLSDAASLDAAAIEELLADPNYPAVFRRVLELRQMGAKSSTAKYQQMLNRVSSDGRLRGMFLYAGAGQTGRYSSTGVQLHNLVRTVPKDAEARIADAKQFPYVAYMMLHSEPMMHQAAQLVRPTLMAPEGKHFVIGDFSAVEARGLPWLAGNEYEVNAWALGVDRYIEDAANVFSKDEEDITPEERQAGKVTHLSCGYGGKGGALMAMAKGYGLNLEPNEADQMARAWHAANPWVEQYARRLHDAAQRAVNQVGSVHEVDGKIAYGCEMRGGVKILRCRLPSGRIISYHDVLAHWNSHYGQFELSAIKPREGHRERLWHGLLAENVTQAACNDLMRYAIASLQKEGYCVVAHVHDEVIVETDDPEAAAAVKEIMERVPEWAEGFPLVAKVATASRYTK